MKREYRKEISFVREIMKEKSDEEICEAEENLRRHATLIWKICKRLEQEGEKKQESI